MSNKVNECKGTLANKVAVVTGATRGIGRAIAERLLAEGASVAICGRMQKSVDDAVSALSQKGNVYGVAADVSRLEDVRNFIAAVKKFYGGADILVNNAGAGIFHSVADLTPEEWDRMIGLNLSGVYYCCHEILPILRQRGGGDVINISSLAGKNPFAGGAGYNASKFGLNGFSEAMMLDHRNDGIRVSYVMPGSVDTEFGNPDGGRPVVASVAEGNAAPAGSKVEEAGSKAEEKATPSSWKIAPEDIAEVVAAILAMPRRTTISRVEIRPSVPAPAKPIPSKIS
jgi:NAD(P)-dependent dehydrogenase (short-subunit alcohol dehydrogenase family)